MREYHTLLMACLGRAVRERMGGAITVGIAVHTLARSIGINFNALHPQPPSSQNSLLAVIHCTHSDITDFIEPPRQFNATHTILSTFWHSISAVNNG